MLVVILHVTSVAHLTAKLLPMAASMNRTSLRPGNEKGQQAVQDDDWRGRLGFGCLGCAHLMELSIFLLHHVYCGYGRWGGVAEDSADRFTKAFRTGLSSSSTSDGVACTFGHSTRCTEGVAGQGKVLTCYCCP